MYNYDRIEGKLYSKCEIYINYKRHVMVIGYELFIKLANQLNMLRVVLLRHKGCESNSGHKNTEFYVT